MAKRICETEGCGEVLSEGCGSQGGLPLCTKCRAVSYYWKKKGVKAFEHRRETLNFWTGRMDYLSAHVGKLIKQAKQRVSAAHHKASSHLHH